MQLIDRGRSHTQRTHCAQRCRRQSAGHPRIDHAAAQGRGHDRCQTLRIGQHRLDQVATIGQLRQVDKGLLVFHQIVVHATVTDLANQAICGVYGLAVILFNDQIGLDALLKGDQQILTQALGLDRLGPQTLLVQVLQLVFGIALRTDDHLTAHVARPSGHIHRFGLARDTVFDQHLQNFDCDGHVLSLEKFLISDFLMGNPNFLAIHHQLAFIYRN